MAERCSIRGSGKALENVIADPEKKKENLPDLPLHWAAQLVG
jgi:hypothetical protein